MLWKKIVGILYDFICGFSMTYQTNGKFTNILCEESKVKHKNHVKIMQRKSQVIYTIYQEFFMTFQMNTILQKSAEKAKVKTWNIRRQSPGSHLSVSM